MSTQLLMHHVTEARLGPIELLPDCGVYVRYITIRTSDTEKHRAPHVIKLFGDKHEDLEMKDGTD